MKSQLCAPAERSFGTVGPRQERGHLVGVVTKRHKEPRMIGSRVGWLFAALLALYLLTSGGHTSSNDDEVMYYVTQGLVERGSLVLPSVEGAALSCEVPGLCGSRLMPDGTFRSVYGLLPSLLAVPLYLVGGWLAQLFEPRFHEFLIRLAVTGLSALTTAWAATILALVAVEVGASRRGGIMLGLLFGTTTLAWPYARSFSSEPVATAFVVTCMWLAVRATRLKSAGSWVGAGLMLGLAAATRLAMLAAVPPLLGYLVAAQGRKSSAASAAAFGLGLLGPALLVAGYNLLRFNSIVETGYTTALNGSTTLPFHLDLPAVADNIFEATRLLLFSPGKSVFLYAPPLVASVMALPAFWRRRPSEAGLCVALVVCELVLLGGYGHWDGESAWGPRYLVPYVPFLMLPLVAWLRPHSGPARWQRCLLLVTAAAGLVVQLFAVATNYNTYVFSTGGPTGAGAERRWYEPAASPLLAAPAQLASRAAAYLDPLERGQYALVQGFYFADDPSQALPRWTTGRSRLEFVPRTTGDGVLRLEFVQPDKGVRRELPDLDITLDEAKLAIATALVLQNPPGKFRIELALGSLRPVRHRLELTTPTFVPANLNESSDHRQLGIQLTAVTLDIDSDPLVQAEWPIVPPLPVSEQEPWSRTAFGWFYDPSVPHLVDFWPWYVAASGLPAWLAWTAVLPGSACVWFGWGLARQLARGAAEKSPATDVAPLAQSV